MNLARAQQLCAAAGLQLRAAPYQPGHHFSASWTRSALCVGQAADAHASLQKCVDHLPVHGFDEEPSGPLVAPQRSQPVPGITAGPRPASASSSAALAGCFS